MSAVVCENHGLLDDEIIFLGSVIMEPWDTLRGIGSCYSDVEA